MPKFIDLTGKTFNQLTIIERAENTKQGKARWVCRCTCGKISTIDGANIRNGHTKSCGCFAKESLEKNRYRHGMAHTSEYGIWCNILQRCNNPNDKAFKDYGGRGITICDEWKNDFMAFYNHVGKRPSPKHSIDRINNDGNYEPNNVRWATQKQQSNNQRSNVKITLYGIALSMTQWAKISHTPLSTICCRIKRGCPHEKAIFQPANKINE